MDKNSSEKDKIEKRAKSIAAMGLVVREKDKFIVTSPSLRGNQTHHKVWRDESTKIQCDCLEFKEQIKDNFTFRCEHILAVKYSLIAANSETQNQEAKEIKKENKEQMNQQENELPYPSIFNNDGEIALSYYQIQKNLEAKIPDSLIRTADKPGHPRYINITDLKDLLDKRAGIWYAQLKSGNQVGNQYILWLTLSIVDKDGNVYSQDGCGFEEINYDSYGDTASNAYSQALKRAAESHGLARELWRKVDDYVQQNRGYQNNQNPKNNNQQLDDSYPENPIAKSLSDLVTAKQLGMIRVIAREIGIDPDEECNTEMRCRTDELSKRAASSFIQHLQNLQNESSVDKVPMRRQS